VSIGRVGAGGNPMQFSTGIMDWLFGEKVTMQLGEGRTRVVTRRRLDEVQRQGLVKPLGEAVRLHVVFLQLYSSKPKFVTKAELIAAARQFHDAARPMLTEGVKARERIVG
jgi:hypothetical protein